MRLEGIVGSYAGMTPPLAEAVAHLGLSADELQLLRGVPAFHSMHDRQLATLMRSMSVHSYPRNYTLFCQGDPAAHFIVVLHGWVRIYRLLPDGSEVTISLFTRGESLAEAAIFKDCQYPVTAVTADLSRLLLVSATGICSAIRDDPELAMGIMAGMSIKLQYLVRQLEQLSYRTTKQRVASFLLTLAERQKASSFVLPLDKNLIAARLGMQPETFSRALTKLKSDGVINEREKIMISDMSKLRLILRDSA